MQPNAKRVRCYVLALLAIYVGSYLVISRVGFRHADDIGAKGFYYVMPVEQWTRFSNTSLWAFYSPLSAIDCWLGTGRAAACDPMGL
jgi:hypothetical protein